MTENCRILEVTEDPTIRRHEVATRLTSVERRLMKYFSKNQVLVTCVGNIGVGKSSLIKFLAYNTGMNALFELPDLGFEDHVVHNESLYPLLKTAKQSAKRTLGRYYSAINDFIECQAREEVESPAWMSAKQSLEKAALDIQHAYLDLRRMQLQAVPYLEGSTCVDGSALSDRYAFCEVLYRDMDISYLNREGLETIDQRLDSEFRPLTRPSLMVLLHAPLDHLFKNIGERARDEERGTASDNGIPEGLRRLVTSLNQRYSHFIDNLVDNGWYSGPVLEVDVSKIDFVSNVRHLIAVYEGIEQLLVPEGFKI